MSVATRAEAPSFKLQGLEVVRDGGSSLSKCHISTAAVEGDTPDLPFHLTGSQKKTAFALRHNCEKMIAEAGVETVGFLTLTVGEISRGKFQQVFDAAEASRRINSLNTHVLSAIFSRAVLVTERHKSGAIHFHVVGALASGADIRTGFDFESFAEAQRAHKNGARNRDAEKKAYASASVELRALWRMLRRKLPGYGFGRAELTPIRKTGEAVSSYVAKYVEKNLFNRLEADRRKKLVRYLGWQKKQLKPNEFGWATPGAVSWRKKTAQLCSLVTVETPADAAVAFGPRWAFKLSRISAAVGSKTAGAEEWSYPARELVRTLVARDCPGWARKLAA